MLVWRGAVYSYCGCNNVLVVCSEMRGFGTNEEGCVHRQSDAVTALNKVRDKCRQHRESEHRAHLPIGAVLALSQCADNRYKGNTTVGRVVWI